MLQTLREMADDDDSHDEWVFSGVSVTQRKERIVSKGRALQCAVETGDFGFVHWLAARLALTAENVVAHENLAFALACQQGRLDMAQWLLSHFKLLAYTDYNVDRDMRFTPLRRACASGHLEIAQWLTRTLSLTAVDARANTNGALNEACSNGHLHVVDWLMSTFRIGFAELNGRLLLTYACQYGRVEVVLWLLRQFSRSHHLMANQILWRHMGVSALGAACSHGRLQVAQRVALEFDLVDSEEKAWIRLMLGLGEETTVTLLSTASSASPASEAESSAIEEAAATSVIVRAARKTSWDEPDELLQVRKSLEVSE